MGALIIFGTGDIAALACRYFERDTPWRVAAFTVDAAFLREDRFLARPVIPFEGVALSHPPSPGPANAADRPSSMAAN